MINQASSLNPEDLRRVMRGWAAGVTVVTSCVGEMRNGMTVNAFASVSLDPPVVLVSLAQWTRTCQIVLQSGVFAVTILGEDMELVSDQFAGRVNPDHEDRFQGVDTFKMVTGCPLITGGLAFLDCMVRHSYQVGATRVFFGDVAVGRSYMDGRPLLYFNRLYRRLQ